MRNRWYDNSFALYGAIIAGIIVFVVAVTFLLGNVFTTETRARHALSNAGYSHVVYQGKSIFFVGLRGCNDHDIAEYTFTALNPVGRTVTVRVCEGLTSATIRN